MITFLVLGDLHIQLANPRNRTDNIKEATENKFNEINQIIEDRKVDYVICTGDIFNNGQVANNTLLFAEQLFRKLLRPVFTTAGNHDLFNYSVSTYHRSSLWVLNKLVPNLLVMFNGQYHDVFDTYGNKVRLTFHEFSDELDNGVYNGYKSKLYNKEAINIHTVHGMLLDHVPPFQRFSTVNNVLTDAEVVISGHDHTGYGIIENASTIFMNPGSLLRLSASKAEIKRKIQVGLLTVKNNKVESELIELKNCKSGEEVLDRTNIDESNERSYAMSQFATILKENDTDFQVNILDVFDQIAKIQCLEHYLIKRIREQLIFFMEETC